MFLGLETARRLCDGYALKALGAHHLKNVAQPGGRFGTCPWMRWLIYELLRVKNR